MVRRARDRHWPTVETGLWILLAAMSLTLRLARLDVAPLAADEVHEALAAWRLAAGSGVPAGGYSPFLLGVNGLLFAVAGTGDGLARLPTALLGSLLPLTLWLLRRRIGRWGALMAGLYLACSPAALFGARHLDGTVVSALGVMLLLGGLTRFLDGGGRRWLFVAAGGLAVAVTGGPPAYGLLLPLAVAGAVLLRDVRRSEAAVRLWRHLPSALLLFALLVVLLGTAWGVNLTGLGATGDILARWLGRFAPATEPAPGPLLLLLVYEPLGLLVGLGGGLAALLRRERFATLLLLWAVGGIVLLWLTPSRAPLDVLTVVLPLALLTGTVAEAVARTWRRGQEWLIEGLYGVMVLVLWIHLYLVLAHYTILGNMADLALAVLTLSLQVVLALAYWLAVQPEVAWRMPVAATALVLLMLTFSAAWRVAQVYPSDPRELLVTEPTAIEVRDLVSTLEDLSWQETGTAMLVPFTFEAQPDGVLTWYLRDFARAQRVDDLRLVEAGPDVVVTSRRELAMRGGEQEVTYAGQDFVLRRHWEVRDLTCRGESNWDCRDIVRWWLFRKTPALPEPVEWAVLWVR